MNLEDLKTRINNMTNQSSFLEIFDSIEKVINYADSFAKDIERMDNTKKVVLDSAILEEQKSIFLSQIQVEYDDIKNKYTLLNMLHEAYNLFLSNYEKILEIDVEHASNKAEAQENKKRLLDENMEILKLMPEPLKKELQAKAKELHEKYNKEDPSRKISASAPVIDYEPDYKSIEHDFEGLLKVEIDELGINALENEQKKCEKLEERLDELIRKISESYKNKSITEERQNELITKINELKGKIDSRYQEIETVKEMKIARRDELNESIQIALHNISILESEMNELSKSIHEDVMNGVSSEIIAEKQKRMNKLSEEVVKYNELINQYKQDLAIIENGGKLVEREKISKLDSPSIPVPEVPTPTISPEIKPTVTSPTATLSPDTGPENKPKKKPSERKKGARKVAKEEKSNTLTGLIKAGKLPRFLKEEDLIDICRAYNINIEDKNKTEITVEQIQLLEEDHEIQMAMLNQNIFDRNATKIAQYDQLMAKYKEILANINEKNFSADYRKKVEALLAKCDEEKKKYEKQNEKIKLLSHEELMKEYDGRAMDVNDKIRSQYQAMEDLKKEAAKKNSKFRQRRLEAKMSKLAKRIERLKGKRSHIASKQQQIVNDKANKYIDRLSARLAKFYERQQGVELSVDRINEIGKRIDQNLAEIDTLGNEIKDEKNLFERIGMRIESGRLKRETGDLQNEMDWEDSHGRYL